MAEARQTTAESFFAAVLNEAGRLGLAWWERLAIILAAAAVVVAVRLGGPAVLAALKAGYAPVDNAPGSDGSAPGDIHDAQPPPEMADPSVSHRPPENESGSGG